MVYQIIFNEGEPLTLPTRDDLIESLADLTADEVLDVLRVCKNGKVFPITDDCRRYLNKVPNRIEGLRSKGLTQAKEDVYKGALLTVWWEEVTSAALNRIRQNGSDIPISRMRKVGGS